MSIVQPNADYTTQQQEEDKKFTGVNELGSAISTIGQLGLMGIALGAAGAFGGRGRRGPKGMQKPRVSTTGIPKSQFNPNGLSRTSVAMSPTERVAQIGLTRSARSPFGPVAKPGYDPIQQFVKGIGKASAAGKKALGKATVAGRKAFSSVGKKVSAATAGVKAKARATYKDLTADPFAKTNVFAGKGPNDPKYRPPMISRAQTKRSTKPKGVPTPFTQAGYKKADMIAKPSRRPSTVGYSNFTPGW